MQPVWGGSGEIPEPTVRVGKGEDGSNGRDVAPRFAQSPLRERFVVDDETNIRRAFELAERGRGLTSPNPMVGAVLVRDGRVVGEGWHEGPGKPHAEPMAIAAAGEDAAGATLYCSLEPCDHFGRTPPCTVAIIEAGISRVVAAVRDPNPSVDGRGFRHIRKTGIEVTERVLAGEAERLNEAYFKHTRTGLPFVTLKLAATLDGKIAAADGSSTWITGEEARADVQHLRAASDAILVGANTAITDDPRLTVRDPGYLGEPPLRIVVDAAGRLRAAGHLFDDHAPTTIATTGASSVKRREGWRAAGADVLVCEETEDGGVSLTSLMEALGKRDVQSVLIEGGARLAGSAVREGILDKVVVFLAPKLLGGGSAPGLLGDTGIESLADALQLEFTSVTEIGEDVRLEAYVHRDS